MKEESEILVMISPMDDIIIGEVTEISTVTNENGTNTLTLYGQGEKIVSEFNHWIGWAKTSHIKLVENHDGGSGDE